MRFLYALQTDDVGGLFAQNAATGEEKRLFHSASLHVRQPATRSDGELIVCSVGSDGGTSHIVVMSGDGSEVREVTEGDSVDRAALGAGQSALRDLSSAGLSRAASGIPLGAGAFAIHQLDLKTGEIRTLVEDEKFDHLAPQITADGTLYFIRRPRLTTGPNPLRMHPRHPADAGAAPLRDLPWGELLHAPLQRESRSSTTATRASRPRISSE